MSGFVFSRASRVAFAIWLILASFAAPAALLPLAGPKSFASDDAFLNYVQAQTFRYFWDEANPHNGLVRDRSTATSPCSVAAVGFGLSAINIAIERGWMDRTEGAKRVLTTLRTLKDLPQGNDPHSCAGTHGWFYHFLDMNTGLRHGDCEVSTIDTALCLMGAIDAAQFFNNSTNEIETEIRAASATLLKRVDWSFMVCSNEQVFNMEWRPETGFGPGRWRGYNEASCLYLLALGAPENQQFPSKLWDSWTSAYNWSHDSTNGFVTSPSLFTHQYSQVWIDFRGINDSYMRAKGSDYFQNSRRATLAQREYALAHSSSFPNYNASEWGFTACDGPNAVVEGKVFPGYCARGAPGGFEDGTIAPTAAGSSLPFAPEECLATLRHLYDAYGRELWTTEGFRDAFNIQAKWWDTDAIGIDQGPMLIMAENFRSGSTWQRVLSSPVIQRGLERAGFTAPPPDQIRARALPLNENKIELTWRDNSAFETGFQIERSDDNLHFATASVTGHDVTRAILPSSPNGTTCWRVRTLSRAGLSGYRQTVTTRSTSMASAK